MKARIVDPIHRQYFNWLYDRVCLERDVESAISYTLVCDRMHGITFKALVPHDENRIADGAELRNDFLIETEGFQLDQIDVMYPTASVFEVLVGLAKRADFMVDMSEMMWFTKFLMNLKLDRYTDEYCLTKPTWRVSRILTTFNERTYGADGRGGIFPLRRPLNDQRRVELWYQMGAYMTENRMY
jgi:hypothetical protein